MFQLLNGVHHVLHIVFLHFFATDGRYRLTNPRIQQAQVIINLCHTTNGTARGTRNYFLLNGNGRTESFYIIYVGLYHPRHKLTGIRTQAFCITTLPFGKQSIDSKGRFTTTAHPRNHNELISWKLHGYVL